MTPRTSERADPANQAEEAVVERRFPSDDVCILVLRVAS